MTTHNERDEIADVLLELTGSLPSQNFAVNLAYKRLTALIATHDQQLLEAILERVNRGTYIDPNLTAGENVAKFRVEVVEHIKSVFKKEGE